MQAALCRFQFTHVGTVWGVPVRVRGPLVARTGQVCMARMPWVEDSSREESLQLPAGKGQLCQHLAVAAVLSCQDVVSAAA